LAKESCIEHPRGLPFIIIKQGYVNLFRGDHALAALMHCFEYFTNEEIGHLDREGKADRQPWFEAPIASIFAQMTGLYSERTIKTGVLTLKQLELIQVTRSHIGAPNKYLLLVDRVNELLQKRFRFEPE
jgi:hypothetical protein